MNLRQLVEDIRHRARRLLFWLPSNTAEEEQRPEAAHDHLLVLQVTEPERIPRWRQFRYMLRVMSEGERRLFLLAMTCAILSFSVAAGTFASSRIVTVPTVGGTYTEALTGQPKFINPLDALTNDVDRDLVRLIYSGLFRFDGKTVVPDLAESYSWSDDQKTLTVKLRQDARFHNGDQVTPDDVRFTFDSIVNPDRTSPLLAVFRGVTVEAVDDQTVTFTLPHPDATFLTKLTVGILPSKLWQDIPAASARLSDLQLKPIGSGPYRVKSFTRDSLGNIRAFTLERFDTYYGFKPYLQTLTFQFYGDRKEALDAFKADLVDALAFVPTADAAKLTSRVHDLKLELPQETIAFFNVKDKTLSNPAVRQALTLAVNRGDLVSALQNAAAPVSGPYPFLTASSTTENLDQARDILTNAGWVLPPNGNVRVWQPKTAPAKPSKNGKSAPASTTPTASASSTELTVTISIPDDEDLKTIADALNRQWSLLGVRVNIETLSTDDLMRRATRDRNAQVVLVNILLGPDQDLLPFWWSGQVTDRGLNMSSYADRTVDNALDAARNVTSTVALDAARQSVSDAILHGSPAAFLVRPLQHDLISNKIHGVSDAQVTYYPAERFEDLLTNWYVKTGWRWK